MEMDCDLVRLEKSILERAKGSYEKNLHGSFIPCLECCPLFLKRMDGAFFDRPFAENEPLVELVDEVEKFIRVNLEINKRELLKSDSLAVRFMVSKPNLLLVFKKRRGIALHKFVTKCRVEWAVWLITTTHLSLKEIAYKMGYDMPCNFSRDFKKYTGMSPTERRQIVMSDEL
jgi:AraC-like DNA-binding protein